LHALEELINTGDRVDSITGCFSGTLGYLCTRLEDGVDLASAIAEARTRALTEPDPREDLSGRDVARKALIIARAAGMKIEPTAIDCQPFVPGLDQGLDQAVAAAGPHLAERVASEAKQGKVLRYTAEISLLSAGSEGRAGVRVGLTSVAAADPIGSLRGQDNMLVYRTARYHEYPLVIRGPGAGAEVTAAGVMGDVLKIARS
jgi:homoserine dehydrogenase